MPGSGEAASYGDLLTTSLLVLGGVCAAAFVVVKVLGRVLSTGSRRGAHLLDVIARVPLEPRRSLYVVDVAGKTLLVGTSEMGLSVLSELDRDAVQSRVVEQRPTTFAELVRNAWLKRKAAKHRDAAALGTAGPDVAASGLDVTTSGPVAVAASGPEPRPGSDLVAMPPPGAASPPGPDVNASPSAHAAGGTKRAGEVNLDPSERA